MSKNKDSILPSCNFLEKGPPSRDETRARRNSGTGVYYAALRGFSPELLKLQFFRRYFFIRRLPARANRGDCDGEVLAEGFLCKLDFFKLSSKI